MLIYKDMFFMYIIIYLILYLIGVYFYCVCFVKKGLILKVKVVDKCNGMFIECYFGLFSICDEL